MKTPVTISRRTLLQTTAALPAINIATAQTQSNKPNILFIMTDQQRGDCIGAEGHPVIKTPNLDVLAHEGTLFRCAYSCTPTCTPARAALLTGLGPWRNGMLGYSRVPNNYPNTKPKILREAGYYTTSIGKNHFHPQRNTHGYNRCILDESGREQSSEFRSDYRAWFYSEAPTQNPDVTGIGFNEYRAKPYQLPERLHPTTWTGDTAVNFIAGYQKNEPFFLKVSFARPHSPYDPPHRFFDLYKDEDIPKAQAGEWAERYADYDPKNKSTWRGKMDNDTVRYSRMGYYGSITMIDEQIGRIIETLQTKGLLENTLIVFTSDHGDMMGDQNLWRKSYPYDPSARIPMIMRVPESLGSSKRGQILTNPVELRDLLPTFMDAAGISNHYDMDGKSMLPLANGNTENWREFIDLEHDVCYSKANHWSALTDGKTKYIFHAMDGEEQLFDLETDPHELQSLAGYTEHESTLQLWRKRLINHLEERGDAWVKNGKLALRPESILHSPAYYTYAI